MYSMKDACQKVGITYETLKFYCNEGLVPNVKRDKNNYRVFDENDLNWISNLSCLKKCGMTIKDMKIYLSLCLQGQSTIPERKKILNNQKHNLIEKIQELNDCVDYIDGKQKFYDAVLNKKIKYHSYLIDVK